MRNFYQDIFDGLLEFCDDKSMVRVASYSEARERVIDHYKLDEDQIEKLWSECGDDPFSELVFYDDPFGTDEIPQKRLALLVA